MAYKLFIEHDVRGMQRLRLSQGAVAWRGRKNKIGRTMRWSKLDKVMQDEARLAERRRPGTRTGVSKQQRS